VKDTFSSKRTNNNFGRKHSSETIQKMRQSAIIRLRDKPHTKPPSNTGRIFSQNYGAIKAWAMNNIQIDDTCYTCKKNDARLCIESVTKNPTRCKEDWRTICRSCILKKYRWKNHTKKDKINIRKIDGKKYNEWRKKILDFFDSRCLWCGEHINVQVDHIRPVSLFPELIYDIDNGRPLCKNCHKKTMTYGGRIIKFKKLSREQLEKINWSM